ncbi:hypothetical protein PD280_22150 [Virgibacillus salarius]|uniref:hypothetical protein n=1 Tax=Virgibacillus salarius TaxID=447199 RepID=UPI00047C000B|nr:MULTISPECIES: hypothetical protein [Bacillaceae]WBX80245.1 hypothetical protein PD280_22150 [Virgibacillus salarius]
MSKEIKKIANKLPNFLILNLHLNVGGFKDAQRSNFAILQSSYRKSAPAAIHYYLGVLEKSKPGEVYFRIKKKPSYLSQLSFSIDYNKLHLVRFSPSTVKAFSTNI